VCNLEENILFSTLILCSVFSDYVVFYGDFINYKWCTLPAAYGARSLLAIAALGPFAPAAR